MRLYDTAHRQLQELPPPPGPIRMYFCGPTVYQRIHIGNARPFVISMWLKRWLERSGYDVTLVENITDINDKIYAAAPGASAQLAARRERLVRRGHGRPRPRPAGRRAEGDRVDPGDRRDDRGARRARARVPGRRRRLLPRRELPRLRQALGPPRRRGGDAQSLRGGRGGRAEGGSARLRALEGAQGGRGHVVGLALGTRPPGLAHRVLGDGRGAPRAGVRDPRRRARPVFPHHENEVAQSRALGHEFAQLWMHNGMLRLAGEKMSKSLGNIVSLRDALDEWGRETLLVYFLGGHWRKPIDYSDEVLDQAHAQAESFRNVFRGSRRAGRRLGRASRPRSTTTSTRPRRWRCMHGWRDHELLRARARGLRARVAGRSRAAPPELEELARARHEARAAEGLRDERPAARRDRGGRLGRARRGRRARLPARARSGDLGARLRAAAGAGGAARPARGARALGDRAGAEGRAVAAGGRRPPARQAGARADRRGGHPGSPGRARAGRAVPLRRRARARGRRRRRCWPCSTRSPTRATSGP